MNCFICSNTIVPPTRDNDAQSPLTTDPMISDQQCESSESPPARNLNEPSDPVDHAKWSLDAWVALTRAFVRYPEGRSDLYRAKEKQFFLELYTKRSKEGTAISWLKFHTSYVFAYAWCQSELPAAPGPLVQGEKEGRPVGGHFGRAFTNVMVRGSRGSMPWRRTALDILMSKLGFPPAPSTFVERQLEAHKHALSKVTVEDASEEVILHQVEDQIAKICKSVFGHTYLHHRDDIPSARACQESSVMEAGGFGELITGFSEEVSFLPECETLFAMVETSPGHVGELRFIDMRDRCRAFQNYVDLLWMDRLDEPLDATPVPILEPLKVRIITKGQAAEYYRCIELQKMMHGALRSHPVFQYIGHPIDDVSWEECFGSRADLAEGEFFVSGDYKAATDNLRSDLSEFCWSSICGNVRCGWDPKCRLGWTKYADLGRKALTGHRLHYSNGESVLQSWGQLMGSPMSFPILCIVNAAATLVALGQDYDRLLTKIRVNGDDIAFVADDVRYQRWKQITKVCGLEFSMGKNYTSREFIIMNSELRRCPASRHWEIRQSSVKTFTWKGDDLVSSYEDLLIPRGWKLEGFVNQCLLYHRIRKGMDAGRNKECYWTDLSDITGELLRGIPGPAQRKLYGIFFRTYEKIIAGAPVGANKWIPRCLGGMGCKLPDNTPIADVVTTPAKQLVKQLKVAAYLACNPKARMRYVHSPDPIVGPIGATLKDLRKMSDDQVTTVLRQSELPWNRPQLLGGSTMLGYLLGVPHIAGGDYDSVTSSGRGVGWHYHPLGGQRQERSGRSRNGAAYSNRRSVIFQLRAKYEKWLGTKSLNHSLTPMTLENALMYLETYQRCSMIEVLRERASERRMD